MNKQRAKSTVRIALPTRGDKGLEDVVSDVFGRARTFTILDILKDSVINVEVIQNPAAGYKHGAGPIAVKKLAEMNVGFVAAKELGVGASTLLEMNKIRQIVVKANIPVKQAIQNKLKELDG